jgi:hypothetical protein
MAARITSDVLDRYVFYVPTVVLDAAPALGSHLARVLGEEIQAVKYVR